MGEKIVELRAKGLSYAQISTELGCSKGLVSYYVGVGQKEKTMRRQQDKRTKTTSGIIGAKLERFISKSLSTKHRSFQRRSGSRLGKSDIKFTYHDVIAKFGSNPVCAYTGVSIDWSQPSTYHFDHIIPASKGGDNSLDNLAICTARANTVKADMTPDELLELCKSIVSYLS